MPTYEFKCDKCEVITEDFQLIKDMTKTFPCSKCGEEASRFISTSNFHLKGQGWTVPEHEKFDRKNGKVRKPEDYADPIARAAREEANEG